MPRARSSAAAAMRTGARVDRRPRSTTASSVLTVIRRIKVASMTLHA
jgi:hypothetical protein